MAYNICEFFVGAGGSHLGFIQQGFKTLYVNDIDKDALKTLLHNNKELKDAIIDQTSITEIDPKKLQTQIKQEVDVIFAGIVCKSFSLAGERSPNDKRNYFYRYYLEIIKTLRPKISIIENVKGMLNAKILPQNSDPKILQEVGILYQELENYKGKKAELRKKNAITKEFEDYGLNLRQKKQNLQKKLNGLMHGVVDDILKIYEELGYRVEFKILNSAWYGSATKRERLIIVAIRNDLPFHFAFPKPTHLSDEINTKLDFKNLPTSFKKPFLIRDAFNLIDYSNSDDTDNLPMQHTPKTIERFKYIQEGKNIQECIEGLPKHLQISKFYSRGNTMRLKMDALSPTLVPGHSNFPLHPTEHRSITIREAATITGFPVSYKFFGSHAKRCEQVGNAVPIALSSAIAKEVKRFLDSLRSKTI
ncbi:DNA cytosine methyltransferase [Helicobacter pylori]|uniref:DNA cytosine methyltransferase n=1 Tax=Helicobacter pylori TaxID=210 RepID=UPI001CC3E9BE|nr:DNA cytosine methyltransferase [Helicobacter pylori]WRB81031.1 DNA cytosine methyltransferase [Helicobacter pylori]BDA05775.1 cytosine-specific methyltransferase [Helicobacter pylori]